MTNFSSFDIPPAREAVPATALILSPPFVLFQTSFPPLVGKTHCRSNPTGHAPPAGGGLKTLVWGEPPALFDFWRSRLPKAWIYQSFLALHQSDFRREVKYLR